MNSGEDEELHALVTGPTTESVQKAVAMVGGCYSVLLFFSLCISLFATHTYEI